MAAIDDIWSSIDINQVAELLGTDPKSADEAVNVALGSLLGAVNTTAGQEQGATGLANAALKDHSGNLFDGNPIDLAAIDASDGDAILGHVFSPEQRQSLSSSSQGGLVERLLPILAPIVMAYVSKQLQGYISGTSGQAPAGNQGGSPAGDILGSILGQVLGGGSSTQATSGSPAGDILGSILGQVLGGQADATPEATTTSRTAAPSRRSTSTDSPFAQGAPADSNLRIDTSDSPA